MEFGVSFSSKRVAGIEKIPTFVPGILDFLLCSEPSGCSPRPQLLMDGLWWQLTCSAFASPVPSAQVCQFQGAEPFCPLYFWGWGWAPQCSKSAEVKHGADRNVAPMAGSSSSSSCHGWEAGSKQPLTVGDTRRRQRRSHWPLKLQCHLV